MVCVRAFVLLGLMFSLAGCRDVPKKLFFAGEEYNYVLSRRLGDANNHIYVPHGKEMKTAKKAIHVSKYVRKFSKKEKALIDNLFRRIKGMFQGVSFQKSKESFCGKRQLPEGMYIFFFHIHWKKERLLEMNFRRQMTKEEQGTELTELCEKSEEVFSSLRSLAQRILR